MKVYVLLETKMLYGNNFSDVNKRGFNSIKNAQDYVFGKYDYIFEKKDDRGEISYFDMKENIKITIKEITL